MKLGNTIVEQVNIKGELCEDVDQSYSPSELRDTICQYFNVVDRSEMIVEHNGKRFAIYPKNVTYLGIPHPTFKKRVQLGDNFKEKYWKMHAKGIEMIILGVYHYGNAVVFVDFDTEKYANNKSHNSSAHVYTSDIQRAVDDGIYSKIDYRDNKITVFTPGSVEQFFAQKFLSKHERKTFTPFEELVSTLDEFFDKLPKKWVGKECYQEMIDADFKDKFQAEWPGFYLEYKFSSYLDESPEKKTIVEYQKHKKKDEIDLDLYYGRLNAYGDLKCHTITEKAIPGNDLETLEKVIEDGSVFYVICDHYTIKDSECDYETTIFWNTACGKLDRLMSYSKRMKGRVDVVDYMILEINKYNCRYLASFQKGFKNSGGTERREKFMITNKEIENFTVYKKKLVKGA